MVRKLVIALAAALVVAAGSLLTASAGRRRKSPGGLTRWHVQNSGIGSAVAGARL
jgi:hypothetical protein